MSAFAWVTLTSACLFGFVAPWHVPTLALARLRWHDSYGRWAISVLCAQGLGMIVIGLFPTPTWGAIHSGITLSSTSGYDLYRAWRESGGGPRLRRRLSAIRNKLHVRITASRPAWQ